MASRLQWITHNDFSKGVMRDVPAYRLPEGYAWEAQNVLITREGSLQKRYGVFIHAASQAIAAAYAQAAQAVGYASGPGNSTPRVYVGTSGGTDNIAYFWSTSIGNSATYSPATTTGYSSGARSYLINQPATWFGQIIFPIVGNQSMLNVDDPAFGMATAGVGSPVPFVAFGGAPLSATPSISLGALTTTANNKTATFTIASSDVQVGMYVYASSATRDYVGRVTKVNSTTSIDVEPIPTAAFTSTSATASPHITLSGTRYENNSNADTVPGSSYAATAHQNRLVLGGVAYGNTGAPIPNRVQWSCLFTNGADSPVTGVDGWAPFLNAGWPKRNYEDLAQINAIVAVVPYGINQLIVLGNNGIAVISGTLGTITADTSTSNYSVKYLSLDVGCVNQASVQVTPIGIMFAAKDGIYLTDGNSVRNVLLGKLQGEWASAYNDFRATTGSALIDNRIYMCGIVGTQKRPIGTLFIDISSDFAITTTPRRYATSKDVTEQLWLVASTKVPGSTRVFGIHNTPARNGYLTLTRLESIIENQDSLDKASYDFYDTVVPAGQRWVYATVQTKAYVEGDPIGLKRFRHIQLQNIVSPALANVFVFGSSIFGAGNVFAGGVGSPANYINAYYVLGVDGDTISKATATVPPNATSLGSITRPSAQTLVSVNNAFSTRFDAQAISPGMSVILTDQTTDGNVTPDAKPPLVWELQEMAISRNTLRRGRTFAGTYT